MREFSEEEAKIVLELVKEAETGNAMKIQDFFAEIEEEERRRKQYRKNMKLGLSHQQILIIKILAIIQKFFLIMPKKDLEKNLLQ